MRMMYTRSELLERLVERLHMAEEKCYSDDIQNADILFDALAMAGFELDSFERAYWHPHEDDVDEIISNIRRGCLEYEDEGSVPDDIASWRLHSLARWLQIKMEEMALDFSKRTEPMPRQMAPIYQLFHKTFSLHEPRIQRKTREEEEARKQEQAEMEKQRAIRHEQLKVHIIHIQTQTDAALRNLDKAITELTELYRGEMLP